MMDLPDIDTPLQALPLGRLKALRPVFEEIGDLKRVGCGAGPGAGLSLSSHAFASAWAALAAGEAPDYLALRHAVRAVAMTVLGPVDATALATAGLGKDEIRRVYARALEARAEVLGQATLDRLRPALDLAAEADAALTAPPAFVARLQATPRAGATCPGKPRIVLQPVEDHAEHCWTVAVYATLIALADDPGPGQPGPGEAFLLGLAHHLHNAWLPDGGFAAEVALGEHLEAVIEACQTRALADLAPPLEAQVVALLAQKDRIDTRAGAAFNAADALDRVLEIAHYERAYAFRTVQALDDLELVHPGPLQAFQAEALRAAGAIV
ncbi:MAG: hypothetical protein AAGI34_04150 [Pseudomonadota bacterium]